MKDIKSVTKMFSREEPLCFNFGLFPEDDEVPVELESIVSAKNTANPLSSMPLKQRTPQRTDSKKWTVNSSRRECFESQVLALSHI